jgi:hypothetical protein
MVDEIIFFNFIRRIYRNGECEKQTIYDLDIDQEEVFLNES